MKRYRLVVPMVLMGSLIATAKPKEPSLLRVVDMSPDAPAIDVLVNGQTAFKALSFQAVSPYVELPGGKYEIQFLAAGNPKGGPITAGTVKLKGKKPRTLVLFGSLRNHQIQVIELKDEPGSDINKSRLRVVHLASDIPAIEVTETDDGKIFKKVSYGKSSDYKTLPPGRYPLEIRAKDQPEPPLKTDVKLMPDRTHTLFLIGNARNHSLRIVHIIETRPGSPRPEPQDKTP